MPTEQPPYHVVDYRKERNGILSENIPRELLPYPQWVCWRYVDRGVGKKPDKQPVNPYTLHNAGVHWKNTWSSFAIAYASYINHYTEGIRGIGFVLTPDDSFVAVDIDRCIQGEDIDKHAVDVIDALQSYTEISPSGIGIRIFIACPDFHANRRTETLEIYSHSRYVTITGNQITGTPATISSPPKEILESLISNKEAETSVQPEFRGVAVEGKMM